jgi:hypothetical protein
MQAPGDRYRFRASSATSEEAADWIEDTIPRATELVNWSEPVVDTAMTFRAEPVIDPRQALHGPFMLTWFDPHRRNVVINYLTDPAIFLELCAWTFMRTQINPGLLEAALADSSRMQIAITNDVLQAMTPTAPGPYSMIRHHALMFLAATLWLPPAKSERWFTIYRECSKEVMRVAAPEGPMRQHIHNVEMRAFDSFVANSGAVIEAQSIQPMIDADPQGLQAVSTYVLYASAAVDILAQKYRVDQLYGWAEKPWLARELTRYRWDGYLLADLEQVLLCQEA